MGEPRASTAATFQRDSTAAAKSEACTLEKWRHPQTKAGNRHHICYPATALQHRQRVCRGLDEDRRWIWGYWRWRMSFYTNQILYSDNAKLQGAKRCTRFPTLASHWCCSKPAWNTRGQQSFIEEVLFCFTHSLDLLEVPKLLGQSRKKLWFRLKKQKCCWRIGLYICYACFMQLRQIKQLYRYSFFPYLRSYSSNNNSITDSQLS